MSQGIKRKESQCTFILPSDVFGHIPKNHFYQRLGELLDLSFVYELTLPLYAKGIGRPSLDPIVFFKSIMVMFFENIQYFTELEYRLADSLTLRRFLGYSLEESVPDESTLRKTFAKMPSEAMEAVLEHVLDICSTNSLIKGETITTDSTLIDANAGLDSLTHRELGCSNRDFFMTLRRRVQYQEDSDNQDKPKDSKSKKPDSAISANETWVSKTDPDAKVMSPRDRRTHLSYRADVGVDMDTGIILSAGAESADIVDHIDFLLRIDEATESLNRRGFTPGVCVADSGHLSGANLVGLEERGLLSVITDRPQNYHWSPGFAREDFTFDEQLNVVFCPEGQQLTTRYRGPDYQTYKCRGATCRACKNFGICTKNKDGRSVKISDYEQQFKRNAERARSEWGRALRWSRMQRGEAPFAFFKYFGGLSRMSGRGLAFAHKKVVLAAACWNLLRLIKVQMGRIRPNSEFIWLYERILAFIGGLQSSYRRYLEEFMIRWFPAATIAD